jgi:hypothetical protein
MGGVGASPPPPPVDDSSALRVVLYKRTSGWS